MFLAATSQRARASPLPSQLGFEVLEIHAAQLRSGAALRAALGEATQVALGTLGPLGSCMVAATYFYRLDRFRALGTHKCSSTFSLAIVTTFVARAWRMCWEPSFLLGLSAGAACSSDPLTPLLGSTF
jgi:hypothetical protein